MPNKNGKLKICIIFIKLNATTKKDPYPLTFTNEVLNTITWYEAYYFLDGYLGYHQISIALEHIYKTAFVTYWGAFIWKMMPFGIKNEPPTYQKVVTKKLSTEWDGIVLHVFYQKNCCYYGTYH
jgi:hypothetical protein